MDRSAVKALLERRGVRVLLTLRRNALQEALSWYRARDMGLSQFSLELGANKGSSIDADEGVGKQEADKSNSKLLPGPVAVNVTRLQGWLAYVEHANAALLEAAELFGRPTLTVWYEDFLADPASVIQQAAEFVGAASPLPGYEPVSKFRKASTGRLRDDVANFEARGGFSLQSGVGRACSAYNANNTARLWRLPMHLAGNHGRHVRVRTPCRSCASHSRAPSTLLSSGWSPAAAQRPTS